MIKGILFGIGLAIGMLGVAGGLMALGAYGLAQDAKTLETSFETRAMEAFDKTFADAMADVLPNDAEWTNCLSANKGDIDAAYECYSDEE